MEHREGPGAAIHDPRGCAARLRPRLGPPPAPDRALDAFHPPPPPARRLVAVPHRAAPMDGGTRVRPRLPSPARPARGRANHPLSLRRIAARGDVELRPRPTALGVHALRRARGRAGRVRARRCTTRSPTASAAWNCSRTSSTSHPMPPSAPTTMFPPRSHPTDGACSTSCATRSRTGAGARSASRNEYR